MQPLADRIRPQIPGEVVGQRHLLGEGKLLANILESGNIPNMIFYGPAGTGKTTLANIAAQRAGKRLYKLNATHASVSDIKSIVSDLEGFAGMGGVLLYLDEIQNFNKKQQQSLLEFIEDGRITLIASTTENPYFYVYNAILSRSTVLEFKPVEPEDVAEAIRRAVEILQKEGLPLEIEDGVCAYMAEAAGGDVRKAITALEVAARSIPMNAEKKITVTAERVRECLGGRGMRYDRDGDSHYDILSAFQKSIRGSDPDAAVHYLARLVAGGDLISICRRLLVIAAEDIGLAYPQAISITKACVDSALQLGFPEARIPLSEAVLLLATAPKSNSAICAIDAALADVEKGRCGDIPAHLKDAHYGGAEKLGRGLTYQYPHNYPGHYVRQQYLPDALKDAVYYTPGDNKFESATRLFMESLKGEKNG
ncbi:MAG: replication-associated recombination protein A [Ruminococcaceae bacterium]|nr:replication-associated recombination protein A [Oscillospiraceae bacterium]